MHKKIAREEKMHIHPSESHFDPIKQASCIIPNKANLPNSEGLTFISAKAKKKTTFLSLNPTQAAPNRFMLTN